MKGVLDFLGKASVSFMGSETDSHEIGFGGCV